MTTESNFDREFEVHVKKVIEENAELLDRLGSDYDQNGVPYWVKLSKQEAQDILGVYNDEDWDTID